jgi:hypothetical protein
VVIICLAEVIDCDMKSGVVCGFIVNNAKEK